MKAVNDMVKKRVQEFESFIAKLIEELHPGKKKDPSKEFPMRTFVLSINNENGA